MRRTLVLVLLAVLPAACGVTGHPQPAPTAGISAAAVTR